MEMKVSQLLSNPFRDLETNPVLESKKLALVYSISELGWWDNIVVRLKGNDISLVGLTPTGDHQTDKEQLEKWYNKTRKKKLPEDIQVEISYGENRKAAIYYINEHPNKFKSIETVDLPIRYITDDEMLKIMIHENLNEWEHGVLTQIESVGQVFKTLTDQVNEFDTFEEYAAKYPYHEKKMPYAYRSEATWNAARDPEGTGIGWKMIKAYIGGDGGYGQNDIQGPLMAIKASQKGYFDLMDCHDIKSGSALLHVLRTIVAIHESVKIPPFFKNKWTEAIFANQRLKEDYAPVSVLSKMKDRFEKGADPVIFMEKGVAKFYNVVSMIAEYFYEKNIFEEAEALAVEGFKDWEKEVLQGLEKAKDKKVRAEKKKEEPTSDTGTDPNADPGTDPNADPGTGSEPPNVSGLDNVTGITSVTPVISDIKDITSMFISESKQFCKIYSGMQSRLGEVDNENTEFFDELEKSTRLTVSLFIEANGEEAFKDLIESVEAAKADPQNSEDATGTEG